MSKKRLWYVVAVAAATVLVMGCAQDESPTGPDITGGGHLFVFESDFQSGFLEAVNVDQNTMSSFQLETYSDATVRGFGGFAYVLERYGADNVMKIDPAKTGESAVEYQVHLGDNWNPQDIDFVSNTKAYVSNMNEPKITIFNPTTGSVVSHIDISAYTFRPDSNTSPYANQMTLVGSNLYVMLQRRNGFSPGGETIILKIDTQSDAIAGADTCRFKNGFDMVHVDGALYISNPGSAFATGDGAIEKLDLATGTVTTVMTEEILGGSPNQIVHKSGSRFYVQNYIGLQNVSVVEIDAATGTVVATLQGITDAYGGICYDAASGKLFVGERAAGNIGVLVFENNVLTAGPLKSGSSLPPSSMAIVR